MPKKRSDKSVDAVLVPFEGAASREDSFDELLLEHLDLMFAVAMKLTRNADDAEDLVHNTIVKALRFHDLRKQRSKITRVALSFLHTFFGHSPLFFAIFSWRRTRHASQSADLYS